MAKQAQKCFAFRYADQCLSISIPLDRKITFFFETASLNKLSPDHVDSYHPEYSNIFPAQHRPHRSIVRLYRIRARTESMLEEGIFYSSGPAGMWKLIDNPA